MSRIITFLLSIITILLAENTQMNIAVMELQGRGISSDNLAGLTNRLRTELFKTGRFIVIERSQMDMVLKEQGFQQSGCISSECAVEVGQLIGADKIVVGDIDLIDNIYVTDIRLVDVETGKIERIATTDCEDCSISEVLRNSVYSTAQILAGHQDHGNGTAIPNLNPVSSNSFNGTGAIEIVTHKNNTLLVDGDTIGVGSHLVQNLSPGKHDITLIPEYGIGVKTRDVIVRPNETIRKTILESYLFIDAMYSITFMTRKGVEDVVFPAHCGTINGGLNIKRHRWYGSVTVGGFGSFASEEADGHYNDTITVENSGNTFSGGGFQYEFSIIKSGLVDLTIGNAIGYWGTGFISKSQPEYVGIWGPISSIRIAPKRMGFVAQYRFLIANSDLQLNVRNRSHTVMAGLSFKL